MRSKRPIDALERSFDAAGQGATAFNRKLIDLAQRNLNSAFDLAKSLAGAKNLAEIVELQSAFIRHQFDVFANQASEIRALTSKIAADTAEPIKNQVARSFDSISNNATPHSSRRFFEGRKRSAQKGLGCEPRAFFYVRGRSVRRFALSARQTAARPACNRARSA